MLCRCSGRRTRNTADDATECMVERFERKTGASSKVQMARPDDARRKVIETIKIICHKNMKALLLPF
jgi:hypothetical protein